MTPDEIASSYTQVHAALAYAYIEAIQQAIRETDTLVEDMKKEHPSELKPLLNC